MNLSTYIPEMATEDCLLLFVLGPDAKSRVNALHGFLTSVPTRQKIGYRDEKGLGDTKGLTCWVTGEPAQAEGFDALTYVCDRLAIAEPGDFACALNEACQMSMRGTPVAMSVDAADIESLEAMLENVSGPTDRYTPELWSKILTQADMAVLAA